MDILEDLRTTTFSNNEAFFKKAACEIEQLRTENAALKEQVAQWETEYNGCSTLLNNAERTIETLEETIAQQTEAIRLKDEALLNLLSVIDSEAYPTIQNNGYDAVARQPSPEILQARDEQVAEACANLVNRFISGDGILNDTWVHEIEDAIRSGEWRKYL